MDDRLVHRGRLLTEEEKDHEYKVRSLPYLEKETLKDEPLTEDWTFIKNRYSRQILRRDKPICTELEDDVWALFYRLGASHLNERNFHIVLKERPGHPKTKELDVVAICDDLLFVVECKSREIIGPKSLKKELAEFHLIKNDIRSSLWNILENRNLRVVFIMATHNIKWDDNDLKDAEDYEIFVWNEYDLLALSDFADHAGGTARYLIYNRIFFNDKIKGFDVKVPAIKARMGGFEYYTFVAKPSDLLKISFVDQRGKNSSWIDLAGSYQRMINKKRLSDINYFIDLENGFFPGSIILNFNRKPKEDELGSIKHKSQLPKGLEPVAITLPPYYGCAWLIDGQHRLFGYADSNKKDSETIPVVAFVNLDVTEQAKIFVDINQNQKPVEKNLLWDLSEDLYSQSENTSEMTKYIISVIAKRLNSDRKSPLKGCIAIPKEQNQGNISLNTICNVIEKQKLVSPKGQLLWRGDSTTTIDFAYDRIACYFDLIKTYLPEQWLLGDNHYVRTNGGIHVLLGIFRDLISANLETDEISNLKKFSDATDKIILPLLEYLEVADRATITRYRKKGSMGAPSDEIREELTRIIQDRGKRFRSPWLEKQEQRRLKLQEKEKQLSITQLRKLLEQEEDNSLEFKGSFIIDMKRYLIGKQDIAKNENVFNEILESIVAFLNTNGGSILVGILEVNKFPKLAEEHQELVVKDNIVWGIQDEVRHIGSWDKLLRLFQDKAKARIGDELFIDNTITVSEEEYMGRKLCRIRVKPSKDTCYLDEEKMYVRELNRKVELKGPQIQQWLKRREFHRSVNY